MKCRKILSNIEHLSIAFYTGCCCTLVTNPIWLIKTRMELQCAYLFLNYYIWFNCYNINITKPRHFYTGFFDAVSKIYVGEGLKGFYKGLIPSLVLVTNGALNFMIYENLRAKVLKKHYLVFYFIF